MKRIIFLSALFCAMSMLKAAPGDTTVVQTFSFNDPRSTKIGTFAFPSDTTKRYEKILMVYSAKCNTTGSTAACGEWDYDLATDIIRVQRYDTIVNADTITITPIYERVWRLGVFITPYGNGLTMSDGWSWIWDVSDFVHELRGNVMLRDANGQQSVDIKFLFIEGTPPRDVISIRPIWSSLGVGFPGYWEGYPLSMFNDLVRDTTITLLPEEKEAKLLSTITGHMMNGDNAAAEFSSNIHTVKSNEQVIEQFQIIQQCSNNPIYPQGGTWIYARAGWCTGAPGKVREFELTPYITNDSINMGYEVQYDPNGVYKWTAYLVTYGEKNHANDVEVSDIIAPNTNLQHKRYNPTLGNPIIKIKNIGANPLTTLEINYKFGSRTFTYQWTGNLSFMQEETITRYPVDWDLVGGSGATGTFVVEVRNPNGVDDPTPLNNKLSSTFKLPSIYTVHDFRMDFRPDVFPSETKWVVKSVLGNVVMAKSQTGMVSNTLYTTDMTLPDGGFYIELTDANEDGMYSWPRSNGNPGSAIFKRKGSGTTYTMCKNFTPFFGDVERFYFGVNRFTGINEQPSNLANLSIYPNPAQTELNLDLSQLSSNNVTATIYDITGRIVATQQVIAGQINLLNISDLSSGIHIITVSEAGNNIWRTKFIKM
jgi:hypothetical protein